MVVVASEPYAETEPMLGAGSSGEINCNGRKNSYADEAYKKLTSSMKADPLQIKSPKIALQLLSTAVCLQNMPLVKQCIENIDRHIEKNNLLLIYASLSKCKEAGADSKTDHRPSAPPIVESEHQRDTGWADELIDSLRHNVLLEIDKNADYILRQKELLDLSYPDLLRITERDTLQVSDELTIYIVIYRWAMAECLRRTLTTHILNVRAVLRELTYAPRYGLISKSKFLSRTVGGLKGPTKSGILDEKEWRLIKFFIEEKNKKRPVEQLPHKWSEPRIPSIEKPKILSSRSSSPFATTSSLPGNSNNYRTKTTCEKCLINFLTCWTAVFD